MAPVSFKGVFPIVITPFDDNENIDLESFDRIIRFMGSIGADGVTILGVLGESNRLTDKEREALTQTAVAASDGLPIIVGTSHPGTRATCDFCDSCGVSLHAVNDSNPNPAATATINRMSETPWFDGTSVAGPENLRPGRMPVVTPV